MHGHKCEQILLAQAAKTKGYLEKKSTGVFANWQKRYFLIIANTLSYYAD
jgi:hypothetical protein